MSEKLKDPSKAAHEIIEVLEDGGAIRNDGVRLTAANKNPWYVLATIYGEQEEGATWGNHDEELAAKNRRAWNGWLSGRLQSTREEVEMTNRLRCRLGDDTAELPSSRIKADFSKVFFSTTVCFGKYIFRNDCEFIEAHFASNALFNSSSFEKNVHFIETTYKGIADFRHAEFKFSSHFRSALFEDVALFDSANFNSNVSFQSATFRSGVGFAAANFEGETQFDWYEYSGIGYEKARYPVRFFGKVDFSSAKFEATTKFVDARFLTHVPEFHGAELFEKTLFPTNAKNNNNWPPRERETKIHGGDKSVNQMSVEEQAFAYNRLQLFMNKTMRVDEEQFFHRMEMRCKGKIDGGAYDLMHTLFDVVSEYGNSVFRPVGWLFVFWLSGLLAKLEMAKDGWWPDVSSVGPAMGWSFANLFSFFGFYRRYFKDEDLNGVLQVLSGAQTVLGFVLLFMLGLGLRNRFRLR